MEAAPEEPIRGPAAFLSQDDEAAQAQAAILLAIGSQMRGDPQKVQARSAAIAHPTDVMMLEDLEEFPIPHILPASRRWSRAVLEDAVRARWGVSLTDAPRDPKILARMADEVYRTNSRENAAMLVCAEMWNEHPLVRVAAANAALTAMGEPAEAIMILAEHTQDPDELVREVAATSLARYMPEHPALRPLVGGDRQSLSTGPAETSMLIHGTFARSNAWYQPPGGDFWSYFQGNVRGDLYAQNDFYRWSGGYSDGARALAADQLVTWITSRNENGISLVPHSHGGSVAMLASWRGVTYDQLILLSCPVHPAKYAVNFAAVKRVVSIRVRFDLVLLADGSGSRFTDARYNERVLPVWFNHSASHDPKVWVKHNVPAML